MEAIAPAAGQRRLAYQVRGLQHRPPRTDQSHPAPNSSLSRDIDIGRGVSAPRNLLCAAIYYPDTELYSPHLTKEVMEL